MDFYEGLFGLVLAMAGFAVFVLIVVLGFYILKGYALFKMAKRRGIENAWLAFIPFGMDYIMGLLIGEVEVGGLFKLDAKLGLPIGRALGLFITVIPLIGWLFPIAYMIYYFIAIYKLYKSYKQESAVLYLVLSIIFSMVAEGVIFFMLKDREPSEGEIVIKDANAN